MSAGDLYSVTANHSDIRRLKEVRRQRLKPLRNFVEGLPCQIRLNDWDSETAGLVGHAFTSLKIDLTVPLDKGAIIDFLHSDLDQLQEWLDRDRANVDAAS
jgi:hypothetical protein